MKIENKLCSNARPRPNVYDPGACQTCISPCEPGKQWLRQMGMQEPERRGEPLYGAVPMTLPRAAKIKMCLNRGYR